MKTDDRSPSPEHAPFASDKIGPNDARYAELARKRFNKRFVGQPDYVRLVGSTAQVVEAVQAAVGEKLRVVVRSGGHCLEGFVSDPAVQIVIDMSLMNGLRYDAEMGAFAPTRRPHRSSASCRSGGLRRARSPSAAF